MKAARKYIDIYPDPDPKASRLRLVVFSDSINHRNGVGAYYRDLLDHLSPLVAKVELICPGKTSDGRKQGLSVPLPGDPTQRLCLPGVIKAVRTMRKVRPHAVIVATPGPYGILGSILARLFRLKTCMGYHTRYDKLVSLYWTRHFGKLAGVYLRVLDRFLFRFASAVAVNSAEMEGSARELGAQKVVLVGTPVQPALLTPFPMKDQGDRQAVLFVGRLAAEKNIDQVIEAARNLPGQPFVIAGDGPLADDVRAAAADLPNLEYAGWLGRSELIRTMDRCSILVLPSEVESFGTVALEAMSRKMLVLVSATCGIRDWPQLSRGLETIRKTECPEDAILRIQSKSPGWREHRRELAGSLVHEFMVYTLHGWIDLLVQTAGNKLVEAIPYDINRGLQTDDQWSVNSHPSSPYTT